MSQNVRGVVVSHRRGPKTQRPRECLIQFHGVESAGEAGQLIGRKIAWPIGEHRCIGKIVSVHGKRGIVRARFGKGLPGDALGSLAEVVG